MSAKLYIIDGKLSDYINYPDMQLRQQQTIPNEGMLTPPPQLQHELSECESSSSVTHPVSRIILPATPQYNAILTRIQRDMNSPSAALRSRALKALKNPAASSYAHFDVEHIEQNIITAEELAPPIPAITIQELMRKVVVYVEVRSGVDNRSAGVKKVISALGAGVNDKLLRGTTHVVFKDGLLSTYRKAKSMNIPIVSILWIEACKNQNKICDPTKYPISNKDRYENPELYEKLKRHKSIQPDSECNKRRRIKPTTSDSTTPKIKSKTRKGRLHSKTPSPKAKQAEISKYFMYRTDNGANTPKSTKTVTSDNRFGGPLNTVRASPATIFQRRSPETEIQTNYVLSNQSLASSEATMTPGMCNDNPETLNVICSETTNSSLQTTSSQRRSLRRRNSSSHIDAMQNTGGSLDKFLSIANSNSVRRRSNSAPVFNTMCDNKTSTRQKSLYSAQFTNIAEEQAACQTSSDPNKARCDTNAPSNIEENCNDPMVTRPYPPFVKKPDRISEQKDLDQRDIDTAEAPQYISRRVPLYAEKSMDIDKLLEDHNVFTLQTHNDPKIMRRYPTLAQKSIDKSEHYEIQDRNKGVSKCRRTLYTPQKMEESTESSNFSDNRSVSSRSETKRNAVDMDISEAVETNTNDMETPLRKQIVSSTLLNNDYNTPEMMTSLIEEEPKVLLFSSTRKPGRRRTQFDVSMDIITQRVQTINQYARRTLVPNMNNDLEASSIAEESKAMGSSTGTLTNEIVSNEKIGINELDKESGECASLSSDAPPSRKKRKLYVPDDVSSPLTLIQMVSPAYLPARRRNARSPKLQTTESPLSSVMNKGRRRTTLDFEAKKPKQVNSGKSKTALEADAPALLASSPPSIKSKKKKSPKNEPSPKKQKVQFLVYTNMHKQQVKVINEALDKLGGFICEENVTNATTHVVSLEPRRTLNLLHGLVRGLWLLKYTWITNSLRAGRWLKEEKYELKEFSRAVEICRAERQAFGNSYKCELFSDLGPFYVSSWCAPMSRSNLRELIILCGGKVVDRRKLAKYVLGAKKDTTKDKICLTPYWALDSITQMQLLKITKYESLFNVAKQEPTINALPQTPHQHSTKIGPNHHI